MPSFEIDVSFEVFCAECGEGLCNTSDTGNTQRRGMPFVQVTPCPKCIKSARDEGYKEGKESVES